MGMSHDFAVAVEEGSTEVRVGTALFGPREAGVNVGGSAAGAIFDVDPLAADRVCSGSSSSRRSSRG